jgi:hypothetical protein
LLRALFDEGACSDIDLFSLLQGIRTDIRHNTYCAIGERERFLHQIINHIYAARCTLTLSIARSRLRTALNHILGVDFPAPGWRCVFEFLVLCPELCFISRGRDGYTLMSWPTLAYHSRDELFLKFPLGLYRSLA